MDFLKYINASGLIIILLFLIGAQAPRIVPGPTTLPNIDPEMEQASFWIMRLPEPDQIFLSDQDYQQLSQQWKKNQLVIDITVFPDKVKTSQLQLWLKEDFSYLKRAGQYDCQGARLTANDHQKIINNVNLGQIPGSKILVKWGLTIKATELMLFPTSEIVTVKPRDIEFNIIAHSGLRLAESIAVLHHSLDQQWLYVATVIGRGWVKAADVGVSADKTIVMDYIHQATKVLIESKAQLWINGTAREAGMGCCLVLDKKHSVLVPTKSQQGQLEITSIDLMDSEKWSDGFLKPTAKTMIEQSFKMLGQPYGWGGTNRMGDCSELIRRLGLVCGMIWPRSTGGLRQGFNSNKINMKDGNKLKAGRTLLGLPGHVMLVIGQIQGKTYVIHNLYGIHGQDKQGKFIKRVARVVISDLSLGADSHKGSLQDRVNVKIDLK